MERWFLAQKRVLAREIFRFYEFSLPRYLFHDSNRLDALQYVRMLANSIVSIL